MKQGLTRSDCTLILRIVVNSYGDTIVESVTLLSWKLTQVGFGDKIPIYSKLSAVRTEMRSVDLIEC